MTLLIDFFTGDSLILCIVGEVMSIDARLAQKRKERVMAKKQSAADTKNKRAAFVQQLESQSPKG